ncbi:MAG: GntR family transcriptional regulator [Halomonadaceae bacterium]|nr:MAG: GntR family transcriptional regulator [Halomonadaceae bacterium]
MPEASSPTQTSSQTRADDAFRFLQAAIIKGELAPGEKIGEVELCDRFNLTRGPLREALGRLESRGLLVRKPHAGVRVVSISGDELLELYHIREVMEGLAARQAAERMNQKEVAELHALLDGHEKMVAEAHGLAYFQAEGDYDFHFCIVTGSQNQKLVQMLMGDLYYLLRLYRCRFSTAPGRPQKALKEHRHIAEAIALGDGELAQFLMQRHIRAARNNIESRLKDGDITL